MALTAKINSISRAKRKPQLTYAVPDSFAITEISKAEAIEAYPDACAGFPVFKALEPFPEWVPLCLGQVFQDFDRCFRHLRIVAQKLHTAAQNSFG